MSSIGAVRSELSGESSEASEGLLVETATRLLLRRIVNLEYRPGLLLSERELMADLDIGRPTLRQAIAHVSDLRLIEALPRKGLQIAPIEVLDVSTVYDARWAIETRVARFAAQRATEADLEALREHAKEPEAEVDVATRASTFLHHDQTLHLAMCSAAGNQYLEDALTRILPASARTWNWVYSQLGPDTQMMFPHSAIVEAVAAGDPDAAERAVEEHLETSRQALTEVLMNRIGGGTARTR